MKGRKFINIGIIAYTHSLLARVRSYTLDTYSIKVGPKSWHYMCIFLIIFKNIPNLKRVVISQE